MRNSINLARLHPLAQKAATSSPSQAPAATPYCIPENGLIRMPELLGNIVPVSRTTIWSWVRSGRFPAPVKLGGHSIAWHAEDIRGWLQSLPRADQ